MLYLRCESSYRSDIQEQEILMDMRHYIVTEQREVRVTVDDTSLIYPEEDPRNAALRLADKAFEKPGLEEGHPMAGLGSIPKITRTTIERD